jgi:hypothetical protein
MRLRDTEAAAKILAQTQVAAAEAEKLMRIIHATDGKEWAPIEENARKILSSFVEFNCTPAWSKDHTAD